jgi:hypothetical protein
MAYSSTTTYVTKDDYFNFTGIDLDFELKSANSDNPTKMAEIFIRRVTNWLYNKLKSDFTIEDDNWDDDVFKQAILYQMEHIIDKGEWKLSDQAWEELHNNAMVNPAREQRYYGSWV